MRSSIAIAAFAAGALAVPYAEKRGQQNVHNVETAYHVVYVTDVVTVTYGGEAPKATPEHYGHHNHPVVRTSTYVATAPKYTPESKPAPKYEAPSKPSASAAPAAPAAPAYSAPSGGSPSSPDAPASTEYADMCLYHHNIHRANHSVDALTWSDDLVKSAKEVATSCNYAHDTKPGGGGYGQNIAAGVSKDNISAVITDMFYNGEEPLFAAFYGADSPDMSNFEAWGHFTQIVWKGTTQVGCYTTTREECPDGLSGTGGGVEPYFTVCNYKNPGNYANEYAANVLQPKGEQSASWDFGLSAYSNKVKKH